MKNFMSESTPKRPRGRPVEISDAEVKAIRYAVLHDGMPQNVVAWIYKLPTSTVSRLVRGERRGPAK